MLMKARILQVLLCAALLLSSIATPALQGNADKPGNGGAKPAADGKAKAQAKRATIPLHIKVSAEGMQKLPSGSKVEIRGQEGCADLQSTHPILLGEASFPDVPRCKILLRIIITGFNVQNVPVDLARYQDPMKVLVKISGPPEVLNARADGRP